MYKNPRICELKIHLSPHERRRTLIHVVTRGERRESLFSDTNEDQLYGMTQDDFVDKLNDK